MSNIRKGDAERYADALVEAVAYKMYGIDHVIKLCLVALYCGGHVLLEGNPGLGKTALVEQLGDVLALRNGRIQFTPDLMPSDITGTVVPNFGSTRSEWQFEKGPIFHALLLADEINRATPKTQAAMLQAMAEKKVTVAGQTYALPDCLEISDQRPSVPDLPFMVLATQNPIDHEGTYDLPEAQADRFMFKILMHMPNLQTLTAILGKVAGSLATGGNQENVRKHPLVQSESDSIVRYRDLKAAIRTLKPTLGLQNHILNIYLASNQRSAELINNRKQRDLERLTDCISYGFGPRAARDMLLAAKAWALLFVKDSAAADGRALANVVIPTLRHRLHLKPGWERSYRSVFPATQTARTQDGLIDHFLQQFCELTTPKQDGYRGVFNPALKAVMQTPRF